MADPREPSDENEQDAAETRDESGIEDAVVIEDSGPEPRNDSETSEASDESPEEVEAAAASGNTEDSPEESSEPLDSSENAEPVTEAVPVAPPPPPEPKSGAGGAIALIFGGVIAGLIGFAVARYVLVEDTIDRAELDAITRGITLQSERFADLSERVDGLEAALAELSSRPADTTGLDALSSDLAGLDSRIEALSSELAELADGVGDLRDRPISSAIDTTAFEAELETLRSELAATVDEAREAVATAEAEAAAIAERAAAEAAEREAAARAETERLEAQAREAEANALRRAALARIQIALDSGAPYAEHLGALDGADVPAALSASADAGVPTLTELQQGFPEAARAALAASIRSDVDGSALDRVMAFLRVQTGARSLEPREGSDPDAILSRAEAALDSGDLEAALSEIEALPDAGRAAMADWRALAATRLEAVAATEGLAADLNAN